MATYVKVLITLDPVLTVTPTVLEEITLSNMVQEDRAIGECVCIYVYTYVCVCMCVYMYVCICVHVCVCVYVWYVCTYVYVYFCALQTDSDD